MTRVAINGLGRVGRAVLKLILNTKELELVAINDLIPPDNLAYLLKYDTVYGRYDKPVDSDSDNLIISCKKYQLFHEKDPSKLPWGKLGVDIVLECTGNFTKKKELEKHLQAGAKNVILSAPAKSEDIPTIVYGVNHSSESDTIVSCASCTTNCTTPVVEVMGRRIGIKKAIMTTVHAYTGTQELVDSPHKKFSRGRAAAANIVPTTTGAAIATTQVLTQYTDKFDGAAIRVPVAVGSIADITFITARHTSREEINEIFRQEANSERYQDIIGISQDPIVSSDIIQDPRATIIDFNMTQVVDGDLVKIMCWYDNEWGYAAQMMRQAQKIAKTSRPLQTAS
jgi:glyceraldehyde 3-phosphate dehydrogenase